MEVPKLYSTINIRNDVEDFIIKYMSDKCNMNVNQIFGETAWKRKVAWYTSSSSSSSSSILNKDNL